MVETTEDHRFDNLPDRLLLALGRVSAHYGQIEHVLTITIRRTGPVAWHEAFGQIEMLRSSEKVRKAVRESFETWADREFPASEASKRKLQFSQVLQKIVDLADARADVIHAAWGVNNLGALRATRKGGLLIRSDDTPAGEVDVENLAQQLLRALWALNQATRPDKPQADQPAPATPIRVIEPLFSPGQISLTVTATGAAFPPHGNEATVFSLRPIKPPNS